MISEVQSICIILMGLLSVLLFKIPPPEKIDGNRAIGVFNSARIFLLIGTTLVTFHFALQYLYEKNIHEVETLRTLTNLIFGFPISYMFCMSMACLQWRGKLRRWQKLTVPVIAIVAYVTTAVMYLINPDYLPIGIKMMALLYAIELTFNGILLYKGHRHIMRLNRDSADDTYTLLIGWTKWSTFAMIAVSIGFPIMTFNTNLTMRSIYGILAIVAGFFYVVSFLGYGIASSSETKIDTNEEEDIEEDEDKYDGLNTVKMRHLKEALQRFEEERMYIQREITIKEVAKKMGVTVVMLRAWLRNSKYEKFTNWITVSRLNYAKHLLLTTNMSSEHIADACGFCNRQYFQKQFIKFEGVSISEWKKERTYYEPSEINIEEEI